MVVDGTMVVVVLVVVSPGVVTDVVVESVLEVVDDGGGGGGSWAAAGPSKTAPSPGSRAAIVIAGRPVEEGISSLRRKPGDGASRPNPPTSPKDRNLSNPPENVYFGR